jgi:hypothetical protein
MRRLIALVVLVVGLVGCSSDTILGVSGVPDPYGDDNRIVYADEFGDPSLTIWRDGRVNLNAGIEGTMCGAMLGFPPREAEEGRRINVARTFTGTAPFIPAVGDTLTGTVFLSTEIDTFVVTDGGFTAVCETNPDTLHVNAWVRLDLGTCGRDTLRREALLVKVVE